MSMIDTFLKAVGFDPTEFAAACEYYKKEFEMMKTGLQGAVGHFNGELVAIRKENADLHAKLDRIEALLQPAVLRYATNTVELTPNGHAQNERADFSNDISHNDI